MVSLRRWAAAAVLVSLSPLLVAADPDTDRALAALKAVSREGQGNNSAAAAWKVVVGKGAAALVPTLRAMKDADPTAANWLRTAVDAIAEGEEAAGRKLSKDVLTGFVSDTANAPAARRIAFELLQKQDAATADKLLAGFLDDPSLELRRDAIAQGIKEAEGAKDGDAGRFRRLFQSARDKDQVEALAKRLEKAGEKVSLTEHLGFVTHWHLIGPFDSTSGSGFGKPYPPEKNTDPKAKLPGKDGELAWTPAISTDRFGMIDLNKSLGKHKDAAAYAVAFITAGPDVAGKPVEVRAGSQNAVQIFLNGEKLFAREEYHHGTRMDQHAARGTLKPGTNVLLLKVCQNAQTESWAQVWGFQCRLCDATGGALPVRQTVPADAPQDIKLGYAPVVDAPKEEKK